MSISKKNIRKGIRGNLKKKTEEEKAKKSKIIEKRLFSSLEYKKARAVMFYVSKEDEVDTRGMIKDALEQGKEVAVPYLEDETKHIIASRLKNERHLELGPYGIYHTKKDENFKEIPLDRIDLVVVPGVAFDEDNNRLGRGEGCYDRFLEKLPPRIPTIGLCFDFQKVMSLPRDSHDFPVSKVITD